MSIDHAIGRFDVRQFGNSPKKVKRQIPVFHTFDVKDYSTFSWSSPSESLFDSLSLESMLQSIIRLLIVDSGNLK